MDGIGRIGAAVVIFVAACAAAPRAAVILDSLVVRVYDNAGVLASDRAKAIEGADQILTRADLAVQWHDCARGGIRRACSTVPAGDEIVVRLVRLPPRSRGADRALGSAFIDSSTGRGTLATVYVDRVEAMAARGRLDPWAMAGRVIAHEIGHLLLGTHSHSDEGVMRGLWSVRDLIRNSPQDWVFSDTQREHLRNWRGARRPAFPTG